MKIVLTDTNFGYVIRRNKIAARTSRVFVSSYVRFPKTYIVCCVLSDFKNANGNKCNMNKNRPFCTRISK